LEVFFEDLSGLTIRELDIQCLPIFPPLHTEPFITSTIAATIVKICSFRKETTHTFWIYGGRIPDIGPIAETWAYCLLRNHFHAVVYIKDLEDLTGLMSGSANYEDHAYTGRVSSNNHGDLSGLKPPSQSFSNFFNAYARGVNIAIKRTGALFQRPFKRIPVSSASYLMQLIVYIHQNPQKHRFTSDFREWNYSSYHELMSDVPTLLQRDRVMELFGSKEDFVRIHQELRPLAVLEGEEWIRRRPVRSKA
jgi:REP-associated tyrosine transposase